MTAPKRSKTVNFPGVPKQGTLRIPVSDRQFAMLQEADQKVVQMTELRTNLLNAVLAADDRSVGMQFAGFETVDGKRVAVLLPPPGEAPVLPPAEPAKV